MRSTTVLASRPLSDPIAADRDLGQQIATLDLEIEEYERDLDKLRKRFVKVTQRIDRLMVKRTHVLNQRLDLIPEVQDVERLRSLGGQGRGMR